MSKISFKFPRGQWVKNQRCDYDGQSDIKHFSTINRVGSHRGLSLPSSWELINWTAWMKNYITRQNFECNSVQNWSVSIILTLQFVHWYVKPLSLITRFMRPTWGQTLADRTQVGPMLARWILLSGLHCRELWWVSLKTLQWFWQVWILLQILKITEFIRLSFLSRTVHMAHCVPFLCLQEN